MLCSILAQTGVAGKPSEFFGPTLNEEFKSNRLVAHAADVRDYMDKVVETSTTPNGVFGMKLLASQTEVFMRRAAEHRATPFASLREALESEFPRLRYIWLKRTNTVAQAVSFYRALSTQTWVRLASKPQPQPPKPVYDRFAIQRCYQDIGASDVYWQGYFSAHNITPLIITYEELIRERDASIQHILRYLNLISDIRIPTPRTEKLADADSVAWEREFRDSDSLPTLTTLPAQGWAPF